MDGRRNKVNYRRRTSVGGSLLQGEGGAGGGRVRKSFTDSEYLKKNEFGDVYITSFWETAATPAKPGAPTQSDEAEDKENIEDNQQDEEREEENDEVVSMEMDEELVEMNESLMDFPQTPKKTPKKAGTTPRKAKAQSAGVSTPSKCSKGSSSKLTSTPRSSGGAVPQTPKPILKSSTGAQSVTKSEKKKIQFSLTPKSPDHTLSLSKTVAPVSEKKKIDPIPFSLEAELKATLSSASKEEEEQKHFQFQHLLNQQGITEAKEIEERMNILKQRDKELDLDLEKRRQERRERLEAEKKKYQIVIPPLSPSSPKGLPTSALPKPSQEPRKSISSLSSVVATASPASSISTTASNSKFTDSEFRLILEKYKLPVVTDDILIFDEVSKAAHQVISQSPPKRLVDFKISPNDKIMSNSFGSPVIKSNVYSSSSNGGKRESLNQTNGNSYKYPEETEVDGQGPEEPLENSRLFQSFLDDDEHEMTPVAKKNALKRKVIKKRSAARPIPHFDSDVSMVEIRSTASTSSTSSTGSSNYQVANTRVQTKIPAVLTKKQPEANKRFTYRTELRMEDSDEESDERDVQSKQPNPSSILLPKKSTKNHLIESPSQVSPMKQTSIFEYYTSDSEETNSNTSNKKASTAPTTTKDTFLVPAPKQPKPSVQSNKPSQVSPKKQPIPNRQIKVSKPQEEEEQYQEQYQEQPQKKTNIELPTKKNVISKKQLKKKTTLLDYSIMEFDESMIQETVANSAFEQSRDSHSHINHDMEIDDRIIDESVMNNLNSKTSSSKASSSSSSKSSKASSSTRATTLPPPSPQAPVVTSTKSGPTIKKSTKLVYDPIEDFNQVPEQEDVIVQSKPTSKSTKRNSTTSKTRPSREIPQVEEEYVMSNHYIEEEQEEEQVIEKPPSKSKSKSSLPLENLIPIPSKKPSRRAKEAASSKRKLEAEQPQEKSKKLKLDPPVQEPPQLGKRTRIPRLEYWKGDHIVYSNNRDGTQTAVAVVKK